MDPIQAMTDLLLAMNALASATAEVRKGAPTSLLREPFWAVADTRRELSNWVAKGGFEPKGWAATEQLAGELLTQAGTLHFERGETDAIRRPDWPAMTANELREWFTARGVEADDLEAMVQHHAGKTEPEMDALYDEQCGPTA